MKKLTILLLLVLILSACGGGGNSGKTVITWVTDNNPARQKQMRIFEKLNPGIKVKLNTSIQSKPEIILTQLASGEPSFDLIDVYNPETLREYIRRDALLDITDMLAADDIKTDIFWDGCNDYIQMEGRIYGIPCNAGNLVLWWNPKLFREAGLEGIDKKMTWEEMLSLGRKLTKRDPESGRITQFGFEWMDWQMFPVLIWQSGGDYIDVAKKDIGFDNPTFRKYFQMFHTARYDKTEQCIPNAANLESLQKAGDWGGNSGGSLFAAETAAMALNGRWIIAELRKHKKTKGLEYDIAPLPFIKGKKPHNPFYTRSTVIPKNSKRKDAAYKFLKYMTTDPYHKIIFEYGDGVPSVKTWVDKEEFLNPRFDDEKRNYIYRDEIKNSRIRSSYPEMDFQKFDSEFLFNQLEWYIGQNAVTLDKVMATLHKEAPNFFYE